MTRVESEDMMVPASGGEAHVRRVAGISVAAATAGLVATIVWVAVMSGSGTAAQPQNAELTTKAWAAFNGGRYPQAIQRARLCIGAFAGAAERTQAQLLRAHAPEPVEGRPGSETERRRILERGPLNDVATCWWIVGQSEEKLGNVPRACEAYASAGQLTYGRCWDPKGWFWSPANAAGDRRKALPCPAGAPTTRR